MVAVIYPLPPKLGEIRRAAYLKLVGVVLEVQNTDGRLIPYISLILAFVVYFFKLVTSTVRISLPSVFSI